MSDFGDIVERLAGVIESRRGGDTAVSWSARLLADPTLAAKKLAEEALETALAAGHNNRAAVIAESADLIYHWLVVLAAAGVSLAEVARVLESREGQSGVAERAGRPG